MKTSKDEFSAHSNLGRRNFLEKTVKIAAIAGAGGITLLSACNEKDKEEKQVSPTEDLMQEHGLLNRILLIYDACKLHLTNGISFPKEILYNSANIIRIFVEDYHEKQEENYLFPRFKKANRLTDLVQTLLAQHNGGRNITSQIMQLGKTQNLSIAENQELVQLLDTFNMMYRPHEAREDTILFPAFREIVSKHEYDSLGEEFEKNEYKLFGQDGFDTMVSKVADIEKELGIYDLTQFTPKI